MVRGKETAEERLLRMIEGPQPAGSPAGRGRFGVPWLPGSRGGAGNFFFDLLARLRGAGRVRRDDPVVRNLRLISRVIWVFLAALGTFVVVNLAAGYGDTKRMHSTQAMTDASPNVVAAPATALDQLSQPLSDYVSSVMQRNPFTGSSEVIAQAPQQAVQSAKERLEALASKLVVVGIDRGPSPEALIEDSSQQRTYFVKVGDQIGGLQVDEIGAQGVVVSYEGEKLLLR